MKVQYFPGCTLNNKASCGTTSFTADNETSRWEHAKLAEGEDDK